MIETYLVFTAFILAFFQIAKRIALFRLNLGFLTKRRLFSVLVLAGLIALSSILVGNYQLKDVIYIPLYENLNNQIQGISINYPLTNSIQRLAEHSHHFPSLDNQIKLANISSQVFYIPLNLKAIGHTISFLWNATLVIIIIYLFYILMTPALFCKRNAKKYFNESSNIIAEGIKKNINSLAIEVAYSIPTIFEAAYTKENNMVWYALRLIDLFSDDIFCKAIVNYNPRALYIIFETIIKNCNRYGTLGKNFIHRLLLLMFTEPNSIFHREEPYHGLGRFNTFQQLIFGNVVFLTSKYYPTSGWFLFVKNFDNEAIKKYFEVLQFSLENFLKKSHNFCGIFRTALNNIAEISDKNISDLQKFHKKKILFTQPYRNLIECSTGIISLIHFITHNAESFPKENAKDSHEIYEELASGIYEVIESLAKNPYSYSSIRAILIEIYLEPTIFPIKAISDRLDILLKQKIIENLEKLFYPPLTASLIYTFGLCEPEKTAIVIHNFLLTKLKHTFIKAYESSPKIAIDMLPSDTSYDLQAKKLLRKHPIQWIRNKEIQELILEET